MFYHPDLKIPQTVPDILYRFLYDLQYNFRSYDSTAAPVPDEFCPVVPYHKSVHRSVLHVFLPAMHKFLPLCVNIFLLMAYAFSPAFIFPIHPIKYSILKDSFFINTCHSIFSIHFRNRLFYAE